MELLQRWARWLIEKEDTGKTKSHYLVSASVRGGARMRPDEVRLLGVGSIVNIYPQGGDEEEKELELLVDGRLVGSCKLVVGRQRALRVTSIVPPNDRFPPQEK